MAGKHFTLLASNLELIRQQYLDRMRNWHDRDAYLHSASMQLHSVVPNTYTEQHHGDHHTGCECNSLPTTDCVRR
jgi:hypothetical protein